MIQDCLEQLLEDVVQIDLVMANVCDLPVPPQISGITTMAGTKQEDGETIDRIGTPTLSLAFAPERNDEGEIDEAPVLKMSDKRGAGGVYTTHTLNIPVSSGYENVRSQVVALQGRYFHVVLTTAEGEKYLCYAVPNTSAVTLDEQMGGTTTLTVKVTLQSMSHVIRLIYA